MKDWTFSGGHLNALMRGAVKAILAMLTLQGFADALNYVTADVSKFKKYKTISINSLLFLLTAKSNVSC